MKIRYVQPWELKRDAALMAAAAVPVSWGASRALVAAGVLSMPVRWVLTILAAYFSYLGLLWLWSAGMGGEVRVLGQMETRRGRRPSAGLDWLDFPDFFDLEGFLIVMGAVLLIWVAFGSVAVAAELAIEWSASCALAACLVRRTNEPWTWALVRRTWIPVALAVVGALIAGTIIQERHPGAVTLREAILAAGRSHLR